jgi:hypothetical protein
MDAAAAVLEVTSTRWRSHASSALRSGLILAALKTLHHARVHTQGQLALHRCVCVLAVW